MLTIAGALEREDQRRFVGRDRELGVIEEALHEDAPQRVIFVCGPGGIGKSALLRAVRRRVCAGNWDVAFLDGRDGAPTSADMHAMVAEDPERAQRRLVILDTFERLEPLGGMLRKELIPRLSDGDRVLVAQRGHPQVDWITGGWERVVSAIELRPLDDVHAHELLSTSGITDAAARAAVAAWAGGSPLALTLGAEAAGLAGEWSAASLADNPDLANLLVRRLTELELDPSFFDVVAVAAIARRTNADLLADVLPDVDGAKAAEWLRERSFTEALGAGLTLHELLRTSLRAWLESYAPEREHELRRRIADHLYSRAQRGHASLLADISELIRNEAVHWAIGGLGDGSLRADTVAPGDIARLEQNARERGAEEWWEATVPLLREAPQCFVLARDLDDEIAGLCCFTTPQTAPTVCDADPILGPWLAHARANLAGEPVIIWRDALDLTSGHGRLESRVVSVMNTAAVLRSGVGNPRWSYLPINPDVAPAVAFAQEKGARRLDALSVLQDGGVLECHLVDNGAGGMLAAHRRLVYTETGAPLPPPDGEVAEAVRAPVTAEAVADALRFLDRPLELARSPLAHGTTPGERADSVRRVVIDAVAEAFGTSAQETLMRELVSRAYMRGSATHSQIANELHVSRTTYFRQLRVATDRIVQYVLDSQG